MRALTRHASEAGVFGCKRRRSPTASVDRTAQVPKGIESHTVTCRISLRARNRDQLHVRPRSDKRKGYVSPRSHADQGSHRAKTAASLEAAKSERSFLGWLSDQ